MLYAIKNAIDENVGSDTPLIGRCLINGAFGADDTCIVEHDVQLTERRQGTIDQFFDIGFEGDVAVLKKNAIAKLLDEVVTQVRLDITENQGAAFFLKTTSSRGPNATGGSGDNSYFSLQAWLCHDVS